MTVGLRTTHFVVSREGRHDRQRSPRPAPGVRCPAVSLRDFNRSKDEHAEMLVRVLWMAMITDREFEEQTWKTLRTRGNLDDDLLDAIRTCYFEKMKPVVGPEQLAALRERYKVRRKT